MPFRMLEHFDVSLFSLINGLHSPAVDHLMVLLSSRWVFIPLYLLLVGLLYRKYGAGIWIILLAVGGLILVSDQLSVAVKNAVERLRPCHHPGLLVHVVNGKCGSLFGFYSSHASNTAALAAFCSLLFQNKQWTGGLAAWCFIVGYSRIYLGAHYPGDVLAGWVMGGLLGLVAGWLVVSRIKAR